MKASSLPTNSSTFSDTDRVNGLGDHTPADLQQLAIKSFESDPIFRGRLALGAIRIDSDGDTLILSGRVPSYYLKQLLQESMRRVAGVANVKNHIVVANPSGLLSTG